MLWKRSISKCENGWALSWHCFGIRHALPWSREWYQVFFMKVYVYIYIYIYLIYIWYLYLIYLFDCSDILIYYERLLVQFALVLCCFKLRAVTHGLQPVGDLLATIVSGDRREVAGRSQSGSRLVAGRLQRSQEGRKDDLVARMFCLLVKLLCDQMNRKKVFGGHNEDGDCDWLQRLTTPAHFSVTNHKNLV